MDRLLETCKKIISNPHMPENIRMELGEHVSRLDVMYRVEAAYRGKLSQSRLLYPYDILPNDDEIRGVVYYHINLGVERVLVTPQKFKGRFRPKIKGLRKN